MKLEPAEIEEGARRLARASLKADWATMPEDARHALRMIVENLAAEISAERSPTAVEVFLLWMGDP